jgi:DNA-binding GntR family transcriptional regulator
MRKSIRHIEGLLKAGDRQGHIEEDMRFHGLFSKAAGNAELCHVLANIQNQIWLYRRKTYDLSSSSAPDAHRAILQAFEKSDRKAAQAAMHSHVKLVRERLIAFIDSQG